MKQLHLLSVYERCLRFASNKEKIDSLIKDLDVVKDSVISEDTRNNFYQNDEVYIFCDYFAGVGKVISTKIELTYYEVEVTRIFYSDFDCKAGHIFEMAWWNMSKEII